jgi:saccharopine dehydrogenase (NAD+, L-lysine forming)
MKNTLGIRLEDKNEWERRVPLVPSDVSALAREHGISCRVQDSPIRVFAADEYRAAGASVMDDLAGCPVVLGVKEMPPSFFQEGTTYVFFSHTIKGQPHNMPMLRRLVELKCNLLDYEKIEDEKGRRLVFFGRYAGLAGMIDGLWMLGQRLESDGFGTPLARIRRSVDYPSLSAAIEEIGEVGREVAKKGLPTALVPLVVGFSGYGHVSQGAQEVFDAIPHRIVEPFELDEIFEHGVQDGHAIWKVVFREEHLVEPVKDGKPFILQEYYEHPERYRGVFSKYLPYLTMLVNCIFWTPKYPRLLTKSEARRLYRLGHKRLRAVADISCDVEGSCECTVRATTPGNPVYVYDVKEDDAVDGVAGNGPAILAVDNLPCELPRESSTYFSSVLAEYIPPLIKCDFSADFDWLALPQPLKNALILHRGQFTPNYRYMKKFLKP